MDQVVLFLDTLLQRSPILVESGGALIVEYPGTLLLAAGLAVQALSLPASLTRRLSLPVVCMLMGAGLALALTGTATLLIYPENFTLPAGIPVRMDLLSLWFVGVTQVAGIPLSFYTYAYLKRAHRKTQSLSPFLASFCVLLLALQLVPLADHMILFLVLWELMVAAAFIGLLFEDNPDVRTGSTSYFFASHLSVLILYVFFLVIHNETGSWLISDAYNKSFGNKTLFALFALGVTGFGIKAGVMPFHFWLPRAHPVAPTYLSALLSGVNVKIGIYGLFVTLRLLPASETAGWFLLVLGGVSAVGGVWYALAQHDLKRLLAYHTVENIGIILMGMGLGVLGAALGHPTAAALGFGGALLHVLNHALFKSLLFVGAGVIYQNTHTRNLEALGGIIRGSRALALFFLAGSVAICGLPPLNGFVSEFLIFRGFFEASGGGHSAVALLMIIASVSLAFAGGLAIACFTKVNAVIFLGTPRENRARKIPLSLPETASLGILLLGCVLVAVFPSHLVTIWSRALAEAGMIKAGAGLGLMDNVALVGLAGVSLAFSAGALIAIKVFLTRKRVRTAGVWACGYPEVTPRMQYTASSFADTLISIAQKPLGMRVSGGGPAVVFPEPSALHSQPSDFAERWVIGPLFTRLLRISQRLTSLYRNDIRLYVSMILVALAVYTSVSVYWGLP